MFKRIFLVAAALAIFLFSGSLVLAEDAPSKWWDFGKWDVDININKDSTFVVRETQTFNFHGNFHWTQRDIAKNKLRAISDVKVFDKDGRELAPPEVEISEDATQVSVKINFDLVDTAATWTFEYKVIGGLGYFDDHDELYWNAISENRDVPIKEVEVRVRLPEEAPVEQLKQTLYSGPAGSTVSSGNYKIIDGKTFRFWGSDIGPYENFTIVAGWPKGMVFEPGILKVDSNVSAAVLVDGQNIGFHTPAVFEENYEISSGEHKISVEKFGWDVKGEKEKTIKVEAGKIVTLNFELSESSWLSVLGKLIYLIPILVAIFLFRRYKNIPKIKKTIIAQYEPPDDLLPAEMGGLVRNSVRSTDFTATLIDLAYRGYLKIIEREEKVLWTQTKKYSLVKRKDFDGVGYEIDFLKSIFGSAETVELSDLAHETSFQKTIAKLPKEILEKLVKEKGYFSSMPMARETSIILAVVAAVLGFIFVPMIIVAILFSLIIAFLISLFLWVVYLVIKPPPLTEKGIEAKWHALGFKEYLQVAERFRLGASTPETFEKYLSYAIVFGVEKKWAERFADIYKTQPDWYQSSTPITSFNSVIFVNSISGMTASVNSAITASSPSGSSGFGGGGGAGGGGGGGGSSSG